MVGETISSIQEQMEDLDYKLSLGVISLSCYYKSYSALEEELERIEEEGLFE